MMIYLKGMSGWREGLQIAIDRVLESPKTTVAASTFSTTMGIATASQWITGVIGWLAALAGLIATIILARFNWLKGEHAKLEVENQKLKNEMLRKKAAELGIDIDDEE
jgi:multisubunit Na+/H+ antiporter MnhF subunit